MDEHQNLKASAAILAESMRLKSVADHIDPQGAARIAELERFCAELGRELEITQKERADWYEENQQLRAVLRRIAEIEHHQKPSITWRDLALGCIRIAKNALSDR